MKKLLLSLILVGAAGTVMAQGFVAPLPGVKKTRPTPIVPQPTVQGAVPQIIRSRQPALMVSPFAPRELGTGAANVYYEAEPTPGHTRAAKERPLGLRLFSIVFW